MTTVETTRGPISADHLGVTLMHEHLFVKNPELEQNFPDPDWDEEAMVETAIRGLNELHAKGIESLVDLTVLGLGRSIERISRVAASVDLNILVGTGFYTGKDLPMYFQTHGPGRLVDCPEPLEEMFIKDLTVGIGDSGIKAAMIKVVTDAPGITEDVGRVLHAAAVAHRETGAPITTHTDSKAQTGRDQQEYFANNGVPLEHVVIGHCGDTTDIDYLRELMDKGSSLGLDRFGLEDLLSDEERTMTIVKLCELGYADRLTISHDASFFSVNRPADWKAEHTPNWHHANISDNILPNLRAKGIDEDTITQIMVRNPARILAGTRP